MGTYLLHEDLLLRRQLILQACVLLAQRVELGTQAYHRRHRERRGTRRRVRHLPANWSYRRYEIFAKMVKKFAQDRELKFSSFRIFEFCMIFTVTISRAR